MGVDDSFRKPGAVPFKWEIRPGVPKLQKQQDQYSLKQKQLKPMQPPPPASPFINPRSWPTPQQKLKPPPAPGSYLFITPEPRCQSFRSVPRARSERWRFDLHDRVPLECAPPGCFPSSPLLRRKRSKRKNQKPETDCVSSLETLSRWSVSSRRSLSSFYSSPASSISSFRSSPRPAPKAEFLKN